MGFGANGGFALQRRKENSYEKRRGLEPTVDLMLHRNKTNCGEKRWGLKPMVDLKKKGFGLNGGFDFILE